LCIWGRRRQMSESRKAGSEAHRKKEQTWEVFIHQESPALPPRHCSGNKHAGLSIYVFQRWLHGHLQNCLHSLTGLLSKLFKIRTGLLKQCNKHAPNQKTQGFERNLMTFMVLFCFPSTGIWTQDLVLGYLSHTPALFCFS
jgi:hypothetical protein